MPARKPIGRARREYARAETNRKGSNRICPRGNQSEGLEEKMPARKPIGGARREYSRGWSLPAGGPFPRVVPFPRESRPTRLLPLWSFLYLLIYWRVMLTMLTYCTYPECSLNVP
eukprot:1195849-Prorocentrum_minimum.AAC.4